VAVATGIAPRHLLELDAEWFDAVRLALARRWTTETELVAATLEVAHAHLAAYVRINAKRGARIPPPLVLRRPQYPEPEPAAEAGEAAARRVSIRELAEMAAGGSATVIEVPRAG
jgi:hypothetical protein